MAVTERKWVGKRVKRLEDPRLLAGKATYVDDVKLPGMLYAAVLGSPHAHARIVSIDTSQAEQVPGVVAVVTGRQAAEVIDPMPAFCAEPVVQHAIAVEKVRFVGEAVAAVAATSRYAAEDACGKIRVEWELLPPLSDPLEAMKPEAAKLHDTLDSNVVFQKTVTFGDVDDAFDSAERVVRRRLRWNRISAQPMETAGAVASYDPFGGRMDVWSNTNMYNYIGWVLAGMLRVPPNKLNLIPCAVGGSFGSKHVLSKCISIAGLLAKVTGRPVKYVEDRVENLAANDNVGPDRIYDAELALKNDGTLTGLRINVVDDYGAYFQFAVGQHGNVLAQVTGPYTIPSVQVDVSAVLTNKTQQGFFRGAGSEVGNWVLERLVDEAADQLGMDGAEIRRKNFIRPEQFPYKIPTGNVYDSGNYAGVLDKALELADLPRWRREQEEARKEGRHIGIGLASCQERSAYSATEWWFWYDEPPFPLTTTPESVSLKVGPMGDFTVSLHSPFWGNSPETVVSQVIAEEFGIEPNQVSVVYEDSIHGEPSAGPGGSRLTVMLSGATAGASRKIKDKMLRLAAHLMETSVEDLSIEDGEVVVKGAPERSLGIPDLALKAHMFRLDLPDDTESGLSATFTYDHPHTTKPSDDRSDLGAFYPILSHATHIPIVEVDIETGQVKILKYYVASDCGTVMNPTLLEGQIVGGIAQGIGTAFLERYHFDENGQLLTSTYMDYLIPTSMEVPTIELTHQETPSPWTQYGVKGGGEGGRMVSPPALARAVEDALRPFNVKVDEIPIPPERIVELIEAGGGPA